MTATTRLKAVDWDTKQECISSCYVLDGERRLFIAVVVRHSFAQLCSLALILVDDEDDNEVPGFDGVVGIACPWRLDCRGECECQYLHSVGHGICYRE